MTDIINLDPVETEKKLTVVDKHLNTVLNIVFAVVIFYLFVLLMKEIKTSNEATVTANNRLVEYIQNDRIKMIQVINESTESRNKMTETLTDIKDLLKGKK